jgi:glycosyltransferase involved in cell wall biosynthesis
LPYVLLEALDAGVPIVASNALGNAELLAAYRGDLFAAEDINGLTELLRRRHAARAPRVQQDLSAYSLETVMGQTEAAYRTLIARKQSQVPPEHRRELPSLRSQLEK